jgi:hypothetical protein
MHNKKLSYSHIHNLYTSIDRNASLCHFDTPTVYKRIHSPIQTTDNRVKAPVQLQGRDAGTTSRVGLPVQLRG